MGSEQTRLGILVGGGPAPGINSVISACAIEANKSGVEVVGVYDGFSRLIEGDATMTTPLGIPLTGVGIVSENTPIHVILRSGATKNLGSGARLIPRA